MTWTPERENKLRELWKKGHTASQIAVLIGNTTRNAVIGKAHRLNLEARIISKRTSVATKTKKESNSVEIKNGKLGRKARFRALLLDKSFEPENPKKLEELTDETCRWPLGERLQPATLFCGRKPLEKFSYCKLHVLYAFQPRGAKEDDQITENDIPQSFTEEKKVRSV